MENKSSVEVAQDAVRIWRNVTKETVSFRTTSNVVFRDTVELILPDYTLEFPLWKVVISEEDDLYHEYIDYKTALREFISVLLDQKLDTVVEGMDF